MGLDTGRKYPHKKLSYYTCMRIVLVNVITNVFGIYSRNNCNTIAATCLEYYQQCISNSITKNLFSYILPIQLLYIFSKIYWFLSSNIFPINRLLLLYWAYLCNIIQFYLFYILYYILYIIYILYTSYIIFTIK